MHLRALADGPVQLESFVSSFGVAESTNLRDEPSPEEQIARGPGWSEISPSDKLEANDRRPEIRPSDKHPVARHALFWRSPNNKKRHLALFCNRGFRGWHGWREFWSFLALLMFLGSHSSQQLFCKNNVFGLSIAVAQQRTLNPWALRLGKFGGSLAPAPLGTRGFTAGPLSGSV